ncbi:hypothetical protein AURDEDRAFT_113204 [Auricularia subglabra TFB-10046 SS5]|nr:hypothetical protein AURDEDRAFT_113204 [Auricularia subglabra TFB-10046 SS5]
MSGPDNPWTDDTPPVARSGQPLAVSTADIAAEFDPLVQQQRQVWADAEGHAPPPASASAATSIARDEPPPTPPKSAPATTLSFPMLSTLAKTFAIPRSSTGTPQPRPNSMGHQPRPQTPQAPSPTVSEPRPDSTTPRQPAKDGAFDFQRFLDQMKMRSAEPVAKFLRSFLSNFSKKTFTVNDQVKVINDFLNFITERMAECEPWRSASEQEFDNAVEAMEKLVMNRLYDYTFTPQIQRTGRIVTTDDLERDQVLAQRIRLFAWVTEEHLEIPSGDNAQGFLAFAEQELNKVNHYKAPRDKLICILNCCKVIFGLIRHMHADEGADTFIPILIFVVLRAHPEHLISNVEYINRFRRAPKLQSEAGYYLSSLMGAISFIETMDHTSLSNITQEEFERNVEEAIQTLPASPGPTQLPAAGGAPVDDSPMAGEESARPLLLPTPTTIAEDTKRFIQRTGDLAQAAQQTISKPLSAIGRIFNEVLDTAEERLRTAGSAAPWAPESPVQQQYPQQQGRPLSMHATEQQQYFPTTYEPRVRPAPSPPATSPAHGAHPPPPPPATTRPLAMGPSQQMLPVPPPFHDPTYSQAQAAAIARTQTPALDFTALSDEIERIDRVHQAARDAARDTLLQIFPSAEKEVAEMVLEANDGDLGRSIEALLEMTGGASPSPPPPVSHPQT